MELEFDKEIDAILRKGRDARGVLVGDHPPEPKKHLDADTIAAFAENALPERTRLLYTEHFADCDRCRKQLSQSIAMNLGADAAAASTLWPPVEKPLLATASWYSWLFRTPSLAIAMGSLVLVFSGVLGFLVLKRQNETAANNAIMSQATEPDTGHGPYYSEDSAANTNTAASNSASANAAPNAFGSSSNTSANTTSGIFGRTVTEEKTAVDDKAFTLDGTTGGTTAAKPVLPVAAAPPPPAGQPEAARDEDRLRAAETEAGKDNKEIAGARKQKQESDRLDRDATPRSLSKVGPSRAGPLQNQSNQVNSNLYDMSVTRSVGGKTFANRNGAWYDTKYSGQSPIMVRRGSNDFKKLDSGLRSIAGELYGTVIVVWKGRAYRIQ